MTNLAETAKQKYVNMKENSLHPYIENARNCVLRDNLGADGVDFQWNKQIIEKVISKNR